MPPPEDTRQPRGRPVTASSAGSVVSAVRLDVALLRRGLAPSRARAQNLIAAGRVRVAGHTASKASTLVTDEEDLVVVAAGGAGAQPAGTIPLDQDYASRAGYKLAGLLQARPDLIVADRRCLDAGASTGGFTDVLLRAGAAQVVAVDVGTAQLRPELAADPRVIVRDGRNVRTLTVDDVAGVVDLTVADLSFISLTLVLEALVGCTRPDGDVVVMVKPQFEVGRDRLGRGGVVRSHRDRVAAVVAVMDRAGELGWGAHAVLPSSLPGPAGNVEFFVWLRRGVGAVDAPALETSMKPD